MQYCICIKIFYGQNSIIVSFSFQSDLLFRISSQKSKRSLHNLVGSEFLNFDIHVCVYMNTVLFSELHGRLNRHLGSTLVSFSEPYSGIWSVSLSCSQQNFTHSVYNMELAFVITAMLVAELSLCCQLQQRFPQPDYQALLVGLGMGLELPLLP